MGKVHYRADGRSTPGPLIDVICGWVGSRWTLDRAEVTCVVCAKILASESSLPSAPPSYGEFRMGCRTPMHLPDELPERPRFPSWSAALDGWLVYVDQGYPCRSPSDPRRFETQVFNRYGGGDGDAAQRVAVDYAPVSQAFELAVTQPGLGVDPVKAASIFTGYVSGRRILYSTKAKTVSVLRTDYPIHEIAAEHGLTVGELRSLVKNLAQVFESDLDRRGLIAHRTNWNKAGEMDDVKRGWKEIADHIGRSVDTAIRAKTWHPPIPVDYVGGSVQALTRDLDDWVRKNPRTRPPTDR